MEILLQRPPACEVTRENKTVDCQKLVRLILFSLHWLIPATVRNLLACFSWLSTLFVTSALLVTTVRAPTRSP